MVLKRLYVHLVFLVQNKKDTGTEYRKEEQWLQRNTQPQTLSESLKGPVSVAKQWETMGGENIPFRVAPMPRCYFWVMPEVSSWHHHCAPLIVPFSPANPAGSGRLSRAASRKSPTKVRNLATQSASTLFFSQ